MKKICILFVILISVINCIHADNIRIISQSENSITVQRTYTATETARYQRVDGGQSTRFSNFYQPGNVGLALHLGFGNSTFGHRMKLAVNYTIIFRQRIMLNSVYLLDLIMDV